MKRVLLALLALPGAAAAAGLTVTRSATVVSDAVNALAPRALPGSVVDHTLTVANPLANLLTPVRGQVIADAIPAATALRVADYGAAGGGPVEFTDGDALGLGLAGSGLGYGFRGLGDATDGLEFSDGTGWTYVPRPDADGYDPAVRGIRVRLTGTHVAGGTYRLRYRTRIR